MGVTAAARQVKKKKRRDSQENNTGIYKEYIIEYRNCRNQPAPQLHQLQNDTKVH